MTTVSHITAGSTQSSGPQKPGLVLYSNAFNRPFKILQIISQLYLDSTRINYPLSRGQLSILNHWCAI